MPKTASGREKKTPLISVVIPVYNVAPYLREALYSVVNQTYKALQILVIDDGSTDGSGEICDEYKSDSRITVIHQKNGGLSNARNRGLDHATGDYIAFLDSDDAYNPSFIEKLLSAIADADIAVCRYTVQNTEGRLTSQENRKLRGIAGLGESGIGKVRGSVEKIIRRIRGITQPGAKTGTYGREDSLRMLINRSINCSVWNKLYRAELWKTIRFPDGRNFEDLDTIHHVFDICTSVTVIDPVLYYNRRRPDSITQTASWKNINDRKQAMLHLEEFVRSLTPEIFSERDIQKIRSYKLKVMIMGYARMACDVQKDELRKEIIAIGNQIGLKNCDIRCRAGFFMVKHCPWLLKTAFLVYRPVRSLVTKVDGK